MVIDRNEGGDPENSSQSEQCGGNDVPALTLSKSEKEKWKLDYNQFEAARKEPEVSSENLSWSKLGSITSDFCGIMTTKVANSPRGNQDRHVAMQDWPRSGGDSDPEESDRLVPVLGPKLSGFYQMQNEAIDGFNEMENIKEQLLPTDEEEEQKERLEKFEQLAIQISNVANILLLAAKIWASVQSMSLSVITSTLDSLLDCLSGFILWFTAQSMRKASRYKYPIGSRRMQPLGIIVFASVMATLGFQILLEAFRQLIAGTGASQDSNDWPWLVGIMGSATLVKLGLYIFCNSFSNEIVKAYALDHFFDVVTNTVGLAAALMGEGVAWWIDPVGAIVLALYTMRLWSMTVWENVTSLTGESAPPLFLQKLTYLCWNHHPKIKCIDTVRAYTFGTHYFCEVDIVLPSDMPLQEAHDIGEALQDKLELVPEVERAFVHLDYEYSHQPEHNGSFKKKPIPLPESVMLGAEDV